MSSSSTFRPDPFAQPFFPTAERPQQPAERARPQRPWWLYLLLLGIVIGGTTYLLVPAVAASSYYSAALSAYADRDDKKAIEQLDRAIAWQSSNQLLRAQRCTYLGRLGEIEKAKADYALIEKELSPNEAKLTIGQLNLRASLHQSCGQFRAGLEDMKRAKELVEREASGGNAMAVNNMAYLAGLAVEFEPGKPVEDEKLLLTMLAECDKAVKSSADERTIVDTRGYLHYLLGNYSQAIADFDKAIATGEKELEQGRKQIQENAREAYTMKQALRELEYSQAVMLGHRRKAHQKAGASEASKKDREAIVSLGFNPDLPLN